MDLQLGWQVLIVTGAASGIGAALPLGRRVTAEECARLVAFLLSEASAPMSGAI